MKPLLCIYHSPCADGFGSAWIVNRYCNQNDIPVEFHPGVYQNPPPDVTDRHVLMVDFSYKMDVLAEMHHQARSLLVLDHHKTARDELSALVAAPTRDAVTERWRDDNVYYSAGAVFDMERSGAGITWDYFYPGQNRPQMIEHIEDRDLWRFRYADTRAINANLFSFPYNFKLWDDLMFLRDRDLDNFRDQGAAIERKHHKDINELLEICTRPMRFRLPTTGPFDPQGKNSLVVPVANLPYTMVSDAGHMLCERNFQGKPLPRDTANSDINPVKYFHPFAACFYDGPEGRNFSLRSRADGADVGEIAKLYGGGGHPHAAGFRVPFDNLAQFEL
jgi:oligoribonuclease NrnB/cAMP/cGMP phosphodiesterase (DHH superfamily)